MRGNPGAFSLPCQSTRSIPACAGEPSRCRQPAEPSAVYPRVCGGTHRRNAIPEFVEGLSPRVRGNRPRGKVAVGREGSIPACAGEPSAGSSAWAVGTVYPRVCGGTNLVALSPAYAWGLSPRVRGNPPMPRATPLTRRSIPACAGEPAQNTRDRCRRRVYPRVCGGTSYSPAPTLNSRGLSPRVRGNPG